MDSARLNLALERLEPHQWGRFERFASEFLTSDYSELRSVAGTGDLGRDAELFSPSGVSFMLFQYSIAKSWQTKIQNTAKRIADTLPDAKVLVYVTNQQIGPRADSVKKSVLANHGIVVDVLDRSWFLDRVRGDPHREVASEALAKEIVDPYLADEGVLQRRIQVLSSKEVRAALLYLGLQWEDDSREKGLTKIAFEALVRSVLRNSHSDARMTRSEIHAAVLGILPTHNEETLSILTNSALERLTKRFIRHWRKEDEFCLTFDEMASLKERMAEAETLDVIIDNEVRDTVEALLGAHDMNVDLLTALVSVVRDTLDSFMLSRGEVFASAVKRGRLPQLGRRDLSDNVAAVVAAASPPIGIASDKAAAIVADATIEILTEPSEGVESRLRSQADAFTLLAFLQETPDVQAAVAKMFSHGTIWLDTTIILPLLAEELVDEGEQRFTKMMTVGAEAGLEFRVTPGVLNETERHMNRSLAFARLDVTEWRGPIPFLSSIYLRAGRSRSAFPAWLERYRGEERPEDDIAEYLKDRFGIIRQGLEQELAAAPLELRAAVQEIWHEFHTHRRRTGSVPTDEMATMILARHDAENYVGVLQRRGHEIDNQLGYKCWWLTLDHAAYRVEGELKNRLSGNVPSSPVMSPDFLVNYLAIGPVRNRISKSTEMRLPVIIDAGLADFLNAELITEADRIRKNSADLPEHVIRRRVRDHLDAAKRREGPISRRGMEIIKDEIAQGDSPQTGAP